MRVTLWNRVTPQALRAEGVLEIDGLPGTSIVYVRTRAKTYLFHATELPKRRLDAYGRQAAVARIENGTPASKVAADLGVSHTELTRALNSAGYCYEGRRLVKIKTRALKAGDGP